MGAILAAGASPALAEQVFNGNFNGVLGGVTATNLDGGVTDLGKFGEIGSGNLDLYRSGDNGVTCGAGFTSCLSLESSDGHYGEVRTLNAANAMHGSDFDAQSGATVSVSFELSGNQRGGTADRFSAGFDFNGDNIDLGPITRSGAWTGLNNPPATGGVFFTAVSLASSSPFQIYNMSFVAPQDMHFIFEIKGGPFNTWTGGDGLGPILDFVTVDVTNPGSAAPEPSTWAMLVAGFGGLGAALRRRRVRLA